MLRQVGQLLEADYVTLESVASDGDTGLRHVWGRPAAQIGGEPVLSIRVAGSGQATSLLTIGLHAGDVAWPSAIPERLRALVHVMLLLVEREIPGREAPASVPHTAAAPVWTPKESWNADEFENIIGDSPALRCALSRVEQVAPTDASVMLLGETGTGKELFARAIHNRSVASRQAVRARQLRGAAADADRDASSSGTSAARSPAPWRMRQGRFEIADGGTLFLDEIGDLPADVQAKLLRVLQEGEFERVGSSQSRKVDVRIVAATHQDLDAAMQGRPFPCRPVLPAERVPDRAAAAAAAHRGHSAAGRGTSSTAASARSTASSPTSRRRCSRALQQRSWPGNVRELRERDRARDDSLERRHAARSTRRRARCRPRAAARRRSRKSNGSTSKMR